jgi:hypothetical protein
MQYIKSVLENNNYNVFKHIDHACMWVGPAPAVRMYRKDFIDLTTEGILAAVEKKLESHLKVLSR